MDTIPSIVSELRQKEKQDDLLTKNAYDFEFLDRKFHKEKNKKHYTSIIQTIANTLSGPLYLIDENHEILWMNEQTKSLFTISENETKKTPCYAQFFNNTSACPCCPMDVALRNKKIHTSQVTKESGTNWEITSIPIFDYDTFILAIHQLEVSKAKKTQNLNDTLHTAHSQKNIIENAALGITVLDKNLNHLMVNPTFCGMTGFEKSEIKTHSSTPIYWPTVFEKEIKTEINRLLQKGHMKMETYFKRKNESLFPVSIIGSTFIDKNSFQEYVILIVDDITKQKATERELKISQLLLLSLIQRLDKKVKKRTEKIEQLLKQKNEFIFQLGHDLKNPLGPLINLIPILQKNETDQHKKEMLEVINRNTNHMKNLIIKTIELAQLQSGTITFRFDPIDLKKACDDCIKRNQYAIAKKNITIKNYLQDPLTVHADKLRIDEVYDNIISNAIKYSSTHAMISITGLSTETTISISIKDTGIGMKKEHLHNVFESFYKADGSRHDFKSSGLGMAICKKIIESHNGHITIYSEGLGKGTTVTFTLQKAPLLTEKQKKTKEESNDKYKQSDE